MKIFKINQISTLFIVLLSLSLTSCSDDDNEDLQAVTLKANFISTVNSRTISFTNISENATSFLWDFGNGTTSTLIDPVVVFDDGMYTVTLTAFDANGNSDTQQDTFVIENIFSSGLLINGDFENGSNPWIQGVDDNSPAPTVTENGNTFYQVNITNPNPMQPFLVNMSQKLEIVQGTTYVLTFDAWSDGDRDIIAGIGLSGGDFSNTVQTVSINSTQQQYQLILTATSFGAPDARVLFDSNGEAGLVNIDNVSLIVQ
ncbi:PKD domain-containing protein [Winogradskyella sp. PE311]|uniref:PKD domain-containing protein n=1 Tax=Winogradskyella sp. PE311 TaxID=3366943 RepID=UPI00397FD020